jgi:hypothetical protein
MKINSYQEVDIQEKIQVWNKWWQGALGRPVFHVELAYGSRQYMPKFPCYPAETPIGKIAAEHKKHLETLRFAADGYPRVWMDFGPGCLATMVGGSGSAEGTDTVWFGPGSFKDKPLEEYSLRFDPDSEWARKIADTINTFADALGNNVILGTTDIGGVLDVIASLRDPQTLLLDLYDNPDEVKRLVAEEGRAFRDCYTFFDNVLSRHQNARSCWGALLSTGTNYMLQSDFAYMISPEMFKEFVAPELARQSEFIEHPCYHLDGAGQIPHVPYLAATPNLQCIQWVPGDGMPPQCEWPELLEQIEAANLKFQLFGSVDTVRKSLRMLKKPENAHVLIWENSPQMMPKIEALLAEFGAA